jgi:diaminopimelate epimerase
MNFKAYKMDGLGNDFLIIDNRKQKIHLNKDQIQKLANREKNIGFDQLIYIEKNSNKENLLRFFNSDGDKAEACGNGNRCIASLLMEENKKDNIDFYVNQKKHSAFKNKNLISVNMGKPTYELSKIPVSKEISSNPYLLEIEGKKLKGYLINVGNPHIIFFDKIHEDQLKMIGPKIENYKFFPDRINVSFAEIKNKNQIILRVWERGAGMTLACGTAACATGYVAIDHHICNNPLEIVFKRGSLNISLDDSKNIIMSGPVSDIQTLEVEI